MAKMPEIITLNTAVQADAGATIFRPGLVVYDIVNSRIKVHLHEWATGSGLWVVGGKVIPTGYSPSEGALTLMNQLNTANCSLANLSHMRRIMNRLQSDGKIGAGSFSGSPD